MKSNMIVNVEFLAGTKLENAIDEAKIKARHWGVAYVKFDFNGISFSIGKNADIQYCLERYRGDNRAYGIISA